MRNHSIKRTLITRNAQAINVSENSVRCYRTETFRKSEVRAAQSESDVTERERAKSKNFGDLGGAAANELCEYTIVVVESFLRYRWRSVVYVTD